jgi:ABC-2 type transport system permease protein
MAIIERELGTYFISPIAYVMLTCFILLSGMVFQGLLSQAMDIAARLSMQGAQAGAGATPFDMPAYITQQFLGTATVLFLFMIPMITMGLFAEEKKRGTMELLLTAPVTDIEIVLGKFMAAVSFFVILLISTFLPIATLYLYGKPAAGPIFAGYLGLFLYGTALVAIGLFISTLTENQIVAGFLGFAAALSLWFVDLVASRAEGSFKSVLEYLSVISHIQDFMKGVLSTADVIFYVSLTLLCLFLTYRSVDSLRWKA